MKIILKDNYMDPRVEEKLICSNVEPVLAYKLASILNDRLKVNGKFYQAVSDEYELKIPE